MDLDALGESGEPVAAGLERILPDGAPAVEAVLDDAHARRIPVQAQLEHARPSLRERQAAPSGRYDAPRERIRVNEQLMRGCITLRARAERSNTASRRGAAFQRFAKSSRHPPEESEIFATPP